MAPEAVIKHYFDVLGIEPTMNKSAIRKAYMKKALSLHPDKCGNNTSEAAFKMIAHAWEVLSDHQLSPSDVHGDAHSVSDTECHTAGEVQALMREVDILKRTIEHQTIMHEQHIFDLQVLCDKLYFLDQQLEQQADLSNDRFLALLDERTANATLLKERRSLQRTVDQQADANHKHAMQLSKQNSETQALKGKIAMQATSFEQRSFESQAETLLAESKIRTLEQQLDDSLRLHDVLFFFLLAVLVIAIGYVLSWSS